MSAAFVLAAVSSAFAQGNGIGGITEATNMVTSYFDPGTKLIYAIGAVVERIGFDPQRTLRVFKRLDLRNNHFLVVFENLPPIKRSRLALLPERGIPLQLPDRDIRLPHAVQKVQPRRIGLRVAAVPVPRPPHRLNQPNALIVPERVCGHSAALRHRANGIASIPHTFNVLLEAHSKSIQASLPRNRSHSH